ncbi:MFS transporter, partial [uncultured Muriicola sp.]|uniref:MFS transporter n=1 Tax=uncultured Muriicola sp. TaxID=1583102 RepID=UPI00261B67FA
MEPSAVQVKMNKSYTILISLIVALGGFLLGFDSAVISGAVKGITIYFEMTEWMLGFSVGCVVFGAMAGNLMAGPVADKFGRKNTLIVVAALFTVSATWSALATGYTEFIIARIIGGVGIGGAILIAPIYIAEIAPPKLRGSLVSFNQLNIVIGISVAYFSNYFLINLGDESWRWMLGAECIPAALFFLLLFFIPRSPRWLMSQQNEAQARETLLKCGAEDVDEEIRAIQNSLDLEHHSKDEPFFSMSYRFPILLAIAIAAFNQLSGINAVLYY